MKPPPAIPPSSSPSPLPLPDASRRRFLRAGGAGLLAASAFPGLVYAAQGSGKIKVGLVGCGGRGSGAASQALAADPEVELVAMADVSSEQLEASRRRLAEATPEKVNVPEENRFIGLDAFQKTIDSGIDVILLATPPGFRPQHLAAAVEKGLHVFCEKPMAVDAAGARSVVESVKAARQKNLNLVAGFCWRYNNSRKEAISRVLDGQIGDVTSIYSTYYTNPVKPMPPEADRPDGMADVEWQVRNWYNFCWLSGDGLVEQAVHSVDKVGWVTGDRPPQSAVAVGGRQVPAHGGNIFDHFHVVYEFDGGVRATLGCRQQPGCFNENADYITGTKGECVIGVGPRPYIRGEDSWRFSGENNDMYQTEHDTLFAAIRRGEAVNDGDWMMNSTRLAILGREAAYTGQKLTWDNIVNAKQDLAPDSLGWGDAFTPEPMAVPGETTFV